MKSSTQEMSDETENTAPEVPTEPRPELTQSQKDAAVVELMASRICHDLISPVGAINNGVEFLQESGPEDQEDGLELISHSANAAAAKLQVFRIAYGAGGRDPNIKPEDVQRAFGSMVSADGKIAQMWDPYGNLGPSKPHPQAFCKMLMVGLMLSAECLPKGGSVGVRAGEKNETLFIAEGAGATIRDNVLEALAQSIPVDQLDPRLVHPYTVGMLANHYGYTIALKEQGEEKIIFSLKAPAPAAAAPSTPDAS